MSKPSHELEPIDGTLSFAPEGLEGRTADEATVVRWVANNIDAPDPDPKECPSPFAWTLLRACRGQDAGRFVAFFIEKLWAKLIPPRSQLEADGPKTQDGKSVIELTDRILAHSQEAEAHALAERVARPRKTAPAPAPAPQPPASAFEAFDPRKEEPCPPAKGTSTPSESAPAPPAAPPSAPATKPARRVPRAVGGDTSPAPPSD